MASINVPNLLAKLTLLMKNNFAPGIHTQEALAEALGIAKTNISNWVRADAVPSKQLPALCTIFSVDQTAFVNLPLAGPGDSERFLKAVRPNPEEAWFKLSSFCIRDNSRVHFMKPNEGAIATGVKRLQLEDETAFDEIETFQVKDKLRIQLTGSTGWHVITLLRDPQKKIDCLSPNAKLTSTTLIGNQERFYLPETEDKYLIATPPEGINELIILVCKDSWPEPITHGLINAEHEQRVRTIAQIANTLNSSKGGRTFEAFKKEFYISHT